jgi:hypothetical protein
VTQPKLLEEFDKRLRGASWPSGNLLRWHFVNARANALAKPAVEENFAFNENSQGSPMKPRARVRRKHRCDAGRGAGCGTQKYRRKRAWKMVKNLAA